MIVIALFLNNPSVANIEILVIMNAPFVIYVTFRYLIDKRLKWLKMTPSVAQGLYWHCRLSMRSRVCVMVGRLSVRLYVHLSRYSLAARRYCGFAAERPADGKYRSIAVRRSASAVPQNGAQQQMRTVPR